RRPSARCRANGSPTIRVAPTSTLAESLYSLRSSLIGHHGNEQIGNAGRAHVAKRGELLTVGMIKQQDAAAEHLALMNRLERPRCGELLGTHHHFDIARLELFHAALEHDAAAVDEDQI